MDSVSPSNPNSLSVFSEESNSPQLEAALATMNEIQLSNENLQQQYEGFQNDWLGLRGLIEQSAEEWKIKNLPLIERVYQRARDITALFESELEQTLLHETQGDDEEGKSIQEPLSWGDICAELELNDENLPTIDLIDPMNDDGAAHFCDTELSNEIPPSGQVKSKKPMVEQPSSIVENTQGENVEPNTIETVNQEQLIDKKEEDASETPPSVQTVSSPNDNQKPGPSSDNATIVNTTPPQPKDASQLNSVPMALVKMGEFTLKSLFMYNRAMNQLNDIPRMNEPPTDKEFRNVRNFIAEFVQLVNKINIQWCHIEPIFMGKVISVFPASVLTQWGLATARGPASFQKLRAFLSNYEELLMQGWLKDMQDIDVKPRANPFAQKPQQQAVNNNLMKSTGAIPKVRSGEASNLSDWDDSPPVNPIRFDLSRSPTPTRHTPRPTLQQQRFDKNDISTAMNQAEYGKSEVYPKRNKSKQSKQGDNNESSSGLKCLGCGLPHTLFRCPQFLAQSVDNRWDVVNRRKICPICLTSRHDAIQCSKGMCDHCDAAHNSTLCQTSENLRQRYKK